MSGRRDGKCEFHGEDVCVECNHPYVYVARDRSADPDWCERGQTDRAWCDHCLMEATRQARKERDRLHAALAAIASGDWPESFRDDEIRGQMQTIAKRALEGKSVE